MIRATMYVLTPLAALTLVTRSCHRAAESAHRAREAATFLYSIRSDCAELTRARASSRHASADSSDAQRLLSPVRGACDAAGMNPDALKDFSAEMPQRRHEPDSPSPLRLQAARLTLSPVSLHQFGLFLKAWHAHDTPWRISTIQLDRVTVPAVSSPQPERFSIHLALVAPTAPTEPVP